MAVSTNIRDWLEHTVGVRADKLVQIYNGVDAERFHPTAEGSNDALRVGFVGRLEQVKNPQSMLSAIARPHNDASVARPVELTIVGSGVLPEPLSEQARETGFEKVVFCPRPSKDVPESMSSFDVFVLSSYYEGISNTILEAMASGVPVVATNVGGNPKLIVANSTGMLYPSDDEALAGCLKLYANDEARRAAHGHAARQRIDERFVIAAMVAACERFYLQCLESKYGT